MWCVQTTKNFGGKEEGAVAAVSNLFTRMGRLKPSAYMLVYVREKGILSAAQPHPLHGQASVCCLAQAAPPSMRLASVPIVPIGNLQPQLLLDPSAQARWPHVRTLQMRGSSSNRSTWPR